MRNTHEPLGEVPHNFAVLRLLFEPLKHGVCVVSVDVQLAQQRKTGSVLRDNKVLDLLGRAWLLLAKLSRGGAHTRGAQGNGATVRSHAGTHNMRAHMRMCTHERKMYTVEAVIAHATSRAQAERDTPHSEMHAATNADTLQSPDCKGSQAR
jgi:hypothetical protein